MKVLLIFILWLTATIGRKSALAFQGNEDCLSKITVWETGEDQGLGAEDPE